MQDSPKPLVRRRHSSELKALVLAECAKPGASVAQVAMTHGLNANLVHKWRRESGGDSAGSMRREVSTFIPLAIPRRWRTCKSNCAVAPRQSM